MVKRIILTLIQFAVFAFLIVVGGFWPLVQLWQPDLEAIPVWKLHLSPTRDFVANGLIFSGVLLILILLIEIIRKKFRPWGLLTLLAYVLAVLVGFAKHLGLITIAPPGSEDSTRLVRPHIAPAPLYAAHHSVTSVVLTNFPQQNTFGEQISSEKSC